MTTTKLCSWVDGSLDVIVVHCSLYVVHSVVADTTIQHDEDIVIQQVDTSQHSGNVLLSADSQPGTAYRTPQSSGVDSTRTVHYAHTLHGAFSASFTSECNAKRVHSSRALLPGTRQPDKNCVSRRRGNSPLRTVGCKSAVGTA